MQEEPSFSSIGAAICYFYETSMHRHLLPSALLPAPYASSHTLVWWEPDA